MTDEMYKELKERLEMEMNVSKSKEACRSDRASSFSRQTQRLL